MPHQHLFRGISRSAGGVVPDGENVIHAPPGAATVHDDRLAHLGLLGVRDVRIV
jgi:hypothetical protein